MRSATLRRCPGQKRLRLDVSLVLSPGCTNCVCKGTRVACMFFCRSATSVAKLKRRPAGGVRHVEVHALGDELGDLHPPDRVPVLIQAR
eukprot:scaffold103786_cov27-Prasinocladus_malaysianus.AAC.1